MPGFVPKLDNDALRRLRKLVSGLNGEHETPVPRQTILALAGELGDRSVTIDFEAAESLGQPMVVLHAPAQRADRADGPPSDADRTDAGPTRSADGPLGEGDESRHGGQPPAALSMLSRREIEIAGCVAEGLSNKQIAARLHIALSTVKDHMHRILVKTGVPNRAAVAAATRPDGPQRRVN